MKYCAICLITKDDNRYLPEWVDYHLRVGFDSIIVYDNGSKIPAAKTLLPFIKLGRVEVHPWPVSFHKNGQSAAYNDCMRRYKHEFAWIAVIDADECICLKRDASIKEFLAEFECYGGVVANWLVFGSGGVQKTESDSQIFTFTSAAPNMGQHIKSIVRPTCVKQYAFPHGPEYMQGWYGVTSEYIPVENHAYSAPCPADWRIRVNHYYVRSREEYEAKFLEKIALGRNISKISPEADAADYPVHDTLLADSYASIKDSGPILPWSEPERPASAQELLARVAPLMERGALAEAELLLCEAFLSLGDEPMIWLSRSILSRMAGNVPRAMHCIRETLKRTGSHLAFEELAAVYAAMGDEERANLARNQAAFKKRRLGLI